MDGHLSNLYINWKSDPQRYNSELATTIDKIIYKTIAGHNLYNIKVLEDKEDIIQNLRLLCLKKLHDVEAPFTNKRIYNFLSSNIVWALKTQTRKLAKYLVRQPIERAMLTPQNFELEVFNFGDPVINDVAYMLSEGYTKGNICKELGINRNRLTKIIDKIKTNMSEKYEEKYF